jgi:hypothetical protein
MEWQSMETAPKEWASISAPLPDLGVHRASDPIMLRGELADGEVIEFRAWWTCFGDDPPYWWDLDAEEPVDWPLLGWRHMTAAELMQEGE